MTEETQTTPDQDARWRAIYAACAAANGATGFKIFLEALDAERGRALKDARECKISTPDWLRNPATFEIFDAGREAKCNGIREIEFREAK